MLEARNVVKKDIVDWYLWDKAETSTSAVSQHISLKLALSRDFWCLAAEGITKAELRDEVPCVKAQKNKASACPGFKVGSTFCDRPCRKLMGNTFKRDMHKTLFLFRYGHRWVSTDKYLGKGRMHDLSFSPVPLTLSAGKGFDLSLNAQSLDAAPSHYGWSTHSLTAGPVFLLLSSLKDLKSLFHFPYLHCHAEKW